MVLDVCRPKTGIVQSETRIKVRILRESSVRWVDREVRFYGIEVKLRRLE